MKSGTCPWEIQRCSTKGLFKNRGGRRRCFRCDRSGIALATNQNNVMSLYFNLGALSPPCVILVRICTLVP